MVFVTGGTGLVGSYLLINLLKQGKKVRALKRNNSNMEQVEFAFAQYFDQPQHYLNQIEWVEGELLDVYFIEEALEGIEQVYHAAAMVSFQPEQKDLLMKTNVQGTAILVDAANRMGVKKFAFISSIASLGRGNNKMTDEECWWDSGEKSSQYSLSKYLAEQEVWRASAEGLDVVIVNPSIILGPGEWTSGSSELFHTIYKGLKFFTKGSTGFVDVRDVAMACIALMESDIVNERFILNAENIKYKELFDYIAEGFNVKEPSLFVSERMGAVAWRIAWLVGKMSGKRPLITKETTRSANNMTRYSNEKIRKSIDYNFISIKQSVAETCLLLKRRYNID